MAAMAHHTVIATETRADGSVIFGGGATYQHYSTLNERGARFVKIELQRRFPGRAVAVSVDKSTSTFAATISAA